MAFVDFADSSLNFELRVWIGDASHIPRTLSEIRYHIWNSLGERHIEMPFPQRDLHIRSAVALRSQEAFPLAPSSPPVSAGPFPDGPAER